MGPRPKTYRDPGARSLQRRVPSRCAFSRYVTPESDLAIALAASRNILVVVPSHVFSDVLRQIKPLMRPDARLVWATKGTEAETGRLLQDVAREALGDQIPLAVISGPTFAKELAAGLPTAISLASTDETFADDLQQLLHCGKVFASISMRILSACSLAAR